MIQNQNYFWYILMSDTVEKKIEGFGNFKPEHTVMVSYV